MKQTRLTSSATLPGSVGGGGDFDGLFSTGHSRIQFIYKTKDNNGVTLIVFMNFLHFDSRMNGATF